MQCFALLPLYSTELPEFLCRLPKPVQPSPRIAPRCRLQFLRTMEQMLLENPWSHKCRLLFFLQSMQNNVCYMHLMFYYLRYNLFNYYFNFNSLILHLMLCIFLSINQISKSIFIYLNPKYYFTVFKSKLFCKNMTNVFIPFHRSLPARNRYIIKCMEIEDFKLPMLLILITLLLAIIKVIIS